MRIVRIRMLTSFAGPTVNWEMGAEVDVPDKMAKRLIARGLAEAVKASKEEPETATAPVAETASRRPAKTRGRKAKKD